LIVIAAVMIVLAALEVWAFWQLGDRDDRRRERRRAAKRPVRAHSGAREDLTSVAWPENDRRDKSERGRVALGRRFPSVRRTVALALLACLVAPGLAAVITGAVQAL
jgi:hypothetical protein